ncbi:hypothetical protein LMG28727_07222 [Paraburkholderia kirstenboschensis]|nr:hypothetical protein LMG28727_07222 [Paraburkholderia kirstenboschensis]
MSLARRKVKPPRAGLTWISARKTRGRAVYIYAINRRYRPAFMDKLDAFERAQEKTSH